MAEVEAAITSREGVISPQVLQEYFCVTTRKLGTDPGIARRRLQLFATLEVVQIDVEMILGAPVDARAPPRGPGAGCPPVTPRQIFLRAGHFSKVTAGQGPPRLIC
jgi:hypothetical protein